MWSKLLALLGSVDFLTKVMKYIGQVWAFFKASRMEKNIQTGRELANRIENAKTDEDRTKILKDFSDLDARQ